jgi:hypothetical protein
MEYTNPRTAAFIGSVAVSLQEVSLHGPYVNDNKSFDLPQFLCSTGVE